MLAVTGSKSEAEDIYREIETFLADELKLKTSQAKSGIKHNTEVIRFLGYDITILNSEKTVRGKRLGQHFKRRTMKSRIVLLIPEAKLQGFADKHGYGNWETMTGTRRPTLLQLSDAEMTLQYSAELRGLAQYYVLATNFATLSKLRYLWIQSYLHTMANKYQSSLQKVATMLNRGSYLAIRERDEQGKTREIKLFQLKDVKRTAIFDNKDGVAGSKVDTPPRTVLYTARTEILQRMDANKCEYCEREGGYFEVHHVRKLADVKVGKQPWEKLMMARKRKTLVLCVDCHQRLTAGKLPDRRHLLK